MLNINIKLLFRKLAASEFELKHSEELFEFWLNKDSTNVWKSWNSKYKNVFLILI